MFPFKKKKQNYSTVSFAKKKVWNHTESFKAVISEW
jgi:hypothetical protein